MGTAVPATNGRRAMVSFKKRNRDQMLGGKLTGSQTKPIQLDGSAIDHDNLPVKVKRPAKSRTQPEEEKRLKKVRSKAPGTWLARLERATTQRMFLIDRKRGEVNGVPQETFELAGSTGNIYSVTIKQIPSCTCPDGGRGNICKHIIYILRLVLKAPSDLEYQQAFLISELKQIFDASPVPHTESDCEHSDESNRKVVEGDCPICFMEFEPVTEDIVWCKAACGNNIHKECFEKWAQSNSSKEVRCVYCRATWKGDEPSLEKIKASKNGRSVNAEGYVNLASDLGISTYRDTSTYHSFWVNRQNRRGNDFGTR